jgi:AcrR family transcriptional regulator
MDAALDVIVRDGFDALTVDAVARHAGVTRPVVYSVFDNLDELLLALLDRQLTRAFGQLTQVLSDANVTEGPLLDTLDEVVRRLVDQVAQDELTWRPILLAPHLSPPRLRERIAVERERIRRQFQMVLAIATASAGTDPDIDLELLSHALLALAEYFGRMLYEAPEDLDRDRLARFVSSVVAPLVASA